MLQTTVDCDFYEALKQFATVADELNVRWLMVGATARVLLLEKVFGWPPGLATEDTDFAIWIENWDQYRMLCERLQTTGSMTSTQKLPKRFTTRQDRYIDLLPYGGVEENNRQVFWPPDRDSLMTVRGFNGAAKTALIVKVNNDVDIPVASPPGLMTLKLFAWEERHKQQRDRDAKDIAYILRNVEQLYAPEDLYGKFPELVTKFDYDLELAAIGALASDVAKLLDNEETTFLTTVTREQVEAGEAAELVLELRRHFSALDVSRITAMVDAFLAGLV